MLPIVIFWLMCSFVATGVITFLRHERFDFLSIDRYQFFYGFVLAVAYLCTILLTRMYRDRRGNASAKPGCLFISGQHHTGSAGRDLGPAFHLMVMEFDEQGMMFESNYMNELDDWLSAHKGQNAIIVTFAHGWMHNAQGSDSNLRKFSELLGNVYATECNRSSSVHRPVLGIYVAWQGKSYRYTWLNKLTSFWSRYRCVQRVAQGSVREIYAKLSEYRENERLSIGAETAGHQKAVLVHIGHSFGGLLLFTAQAQGLIESAVYKSGVRPNVADLVVLVNPAFPASAYLPIHEALSRSSNLFEADEGKPFFISATSENDNATRILFRFGMFLRLILEGFRGPQQRRSLNSTMGHIKQLQTHALSRSASCGCEESRLSSSPHKSPFWVVRVDKDVISGHNDIFTNNFIDFLLRKIKIRLG